MLRNSQGPYSWLSLSKAAVPAHRKHPEVSRQRWMMMHLSSRPGTSGQEGDQPTGSAGVEAWHAALQVRNPAFLCCLLTCVLSSSHPTPLGLTAVGKKPYFHSPHYLKFPSHSHVCLVIYSFFFFFPFCCLFIYFSISKWFLFFPL